MATMIVKPYQLEPQYACNAQRTFTYRDDVKDTHSENYIVRGGVVREAALDWVKALCRIQETSASPEEKEDAEKALEARVREDLEKAFDGIPYGTEQQRAILCSDAFRQIKRYVTCEAKRPHDWERFHPVPLTVPLGCGVEVEGVIPDLIDVKAPPVDEKGVPAADLAIEVIKIKCSKPRITQEEAGSSLELYALAKAAERYVLPGVKAHICASLYYLRKENDSNGTKPNFDKDFFDVKGGRNIVSLEEFCTGGVTPSDLDLRFADTVRAYAEGTDREECQKEDCERCQMYDICHYTLPPSPLVREEVRRSVRTLRLTKDQERVVNAEKGVWVVNAGAGAGKTMTVALRVVTLISNGVLPSEIFLVTFTNAGAEEMIERIRMYLADFGIEDDISGLKCMTFNAFGDEIITREYASLGFTSPPKVIDDIERSGIIQDLLVDHPVTGLDYRNFTMNSKNVRGALAMTKKIFDIVKQGEGGVSYGLSDIDKVYAALGPDRRFARDGYDTVRQVISLYDLYDEKMREESLIEFADQEVLLFEILRRDPHYLERYGFRHILVDEFQDSNAGQIELIKKLCEAPSFESLQVVGDDAQAIFGFRNTSPKFMLGFDEIMKGYAINHADLTVNMRCTPEIVELAQKVLEKNVSRSVKVLTSGRPSGAPVIVKGFHTKEEERGYVLQGIKDRLLAGRKPEEIAVIAADKYELMAMASLLTEEKVPSVMLNPELLIENSRVRAAISLMAVIDEPDDTKDLLVYVNARLKGRIMELEKEAVDPVIEEVREEIRTAKSLSGTDQKNFVLSLLSAIDTDDEVYESFLKTMEVKRGVPQMMSYCRSFYEFGSQAGYRRVHDYPGVVLTTAHSSKGLEWPVVFNMITKYHTPEIDTNYQALEERRRLLFVSITRARDEYIGTFVYQAYGRKGSYVYNRFGKELYAITGQEFSETKIARERFELDQAKAAKNKEEAPSEEEKKSA